MTHNGQQLCVRQGIWNTSRPEL